MQESHNDKYEEKRKKEKQETATTISGLLSTIFFRLISVLLLFRMLYL